MSLIEEIKSVAKIIHQAGNIELYEKILNLQGEILEIMNQNRKLKEEVSKLKQKLKIKNSLKFEDNNYYIIDEKRE